jgi:hypothetical protein
VVSRDWPLLVSAFDDSFQWSLDVAGGFARAYPREVAAVERVRAFVRRDRAHVECNDVLFTLALVAGAIERDLGPVHRHGTRFPRPRALLAGRVDRLPARAAPRWDSDMR